MDITVIIPTYKPGKYLWQCLDSLTNQTMPRDRYEIIIVLNGCKHPFIDEINNYILNHADINFTLIYTEVAGVSNARNVGLDNANGEYITFIDDDDFVSECYLEELYNKTDFDTIALSNTLAFYVENEWLPNQNITKDYCCTEQNFPFYKARRFFNGPVYKLIHKDIIGDRRYDVSFKNGEDTLFMFLISDKFNKVVFTSESAIYYRRLRLNSASQVERRFIDRIINGTRLLLQYIKIFITGFPHYNIHFLITRIIGNFR